MGAFEEMTSTILSEKTILSFSLGVVLTAVLVVILLACCVRRRRRMRQEAKEVSMSHLDMESEDVNEMGLDYDMGAIDYELAESTPCDEDRSGKED